MKLSPIKLVLISAGWVSLALAFVGIFLPLLPTTPFVLLAAFCFSKSSERWHRWLLTQPRMGPLIRNWEQYGSISKQAKWMATMLIVGIFSFTLTFVAFGNLVKAILLLIATGVLVFIWTRPFPPYDKGMQAPMGLIE